MFVCLFVFLGFLNYDSSSRIHMEKQERMMPTCKEERTHVEVKTRAGERIPGSMEALVLVAEALILAVLPSVL